MAMKLFVPLAVAGRGEQIAGQLLAHEPIVGFVGVERGDHIIAIAPGVAVGDVLVHSVGVGIAGHVEPVPAPMFAIGAAKPAADRPTARRRRAGRRPRIPPARPA